MLRIAGVLLLLVALYAALFSANPNAMRTDNLIDVANRQGFLGVLTIGVAILIITGSIDLSMGSLIGLSGVAFAALIQNGIHPYLAFVMMLLGCTLVGLGHGLLVTYLKLQAFLVTLCGLFIYRGLARKLSEKEVGLQELKRLEGGAYTNSLDQLRMIFVGKDNESVLVMPMELIWMLAIAIALGIVLHTTVFGRYWYAIGYNEAAAKYSGIATNRHRIIPFMICSCLAGLGGMMDFLNVGSINPANAGETQELYAITGAVLGGCSLRGGEGMMLGIVLGAGVLPLLRNLVSFMNVKDAIIPVIIGMTLLIGTLIDELIRRFTKTSK